MPAAGQTMRRPLPGRRQGECARGEAGSVTIELAIVFPVLLLVITAILQYGLWFYARSLALAAAEEGVTAARTTTTTTAVGTDRALGFVSGHGADTLLEPVATTIATPGQVTVTVTGRSLSVLPGVAGLPITATATGPVERFTTPDAP